VGFNPRFGGNVVVGVKPKEIGGRVELGRDNITYWEGGLKWNCLKKKYLFLNSSL